MRTSFVHLKPARSNAEESVKIVSDFDALISKKVGFKWNNKIYVVHPLDVENYMATTLAYQRLCELTTSRSQGEAVSQEEIYQTYFELITPLVPEFTFEELKKLPFSLLNHLLNLILRQIAGDPSLTGEGEEKKNPLKPTRS